MRGYLLVAAAAAVVTAAALGVTVDTVVTDGRELVVETTDGDVLLSHPVEEGSVVSLEYTHSVEKTEVDDVYLVEGEDLVMNRTEFRSFGAGLPTGDVERNEDGFYVHRPDAVRRDDLVVSTGEIAGHELVVDGTRYDIAEMADGGTVHLEITRR